MVTQDRLHLTLGDLLRKDLSLEAIAFVLLITHYYRNEPVAPSQMEDLFDRRPNRVVSEGVKRAILEELVAQDLLHRYAFLGSIRHQSKLVPIPEKPEKREENT